MYSGVKRIHIAVKTDLQNFWWGGVAGGGLKLRQFTRATLGWQ